MLGTIGRARVNGVRMSFVFGHLKDKMRYCKDHYDSLKEAALRESHEIRKKFSWDNAVRIATGYLARHIKDTPEELKEPPKQTRKAPPRQDAFSFDYL